MSDTATTQFPETVADFDFLWTSATMLRKHCMVLSTFRSVLDPTQFAMPLATLRRDLLSLTQCVDRLEKAFYQ